MRKDNVKVNKIIISIVCILLEMISGQNVLAKKRVEDKTIPDSSKVRIIPSEAQKWNGNYYMVYEDSMEWDEAEKQCEAMGGHLVTITTSGEQNFINSLELECTDYWMGGTDVDVEGKWRWITGEDWQYENWHEKQPDNDMQIENYLALVTSWDNEWNDVPVEGATGDLGFICEWEKCE